MCFGEGQGHPGMRMHGLRVGAGGMCGCMGGPNPVPLHEGCCHGRRFLSRKERIEMLEGYREALKQELEGVEEALEELRRE